MSQLSLAQGHKCVCVCVAVCLVGRLVVSGYIYLLLRFLVVSSFLMCSSFIYAFVLLFFCSFPSFFLSFFHSFFLSFFLVFKWFNPHLLVQMCVEFLLDVIF